MKKKVTAVTVSQNYLERKKYSIKYLFVAYRQTGEAFWFVRHIGETGFNRDVLELTAQQYGFENRIPYLLDIRHGDYVSTGQMEKLEEYGVTV